MEVFEPLQYTNPHVATAMDVARHYIAHETDRQEDTIENLDDLTDELRYEH